MFSRRGLFGIFAGVAAAGPAVAASLRTAPSAKRFHSGGIVKAPKHGLPLHGEFPTAYPPFASPALKIDRVLVNGMPVNALDWALDIDSDGKVIGLVKLDRDLDITGCA